jgi:hypothetical protein
MRSFRRISFAEISKEIFQTGSTFSCDLTKTSPMAAAPFFFQILLAGWEGLPFEVARRSIIIEVFPNPVSGGEPPGDKAKTERELAEATARRIAKEMIQGEFGSASERDDSIAQIGSLSEEIRDQPPTLQKGSVRVWWL